MSSLERFHAPAAIAIAALLCVPTTLPAADHLDAPGLTSPGGDGRLDLNDVYAFQSPADAGHVVLVMTVNPGAGALSPRTFHPGASYEFLVDVDGDAKQDRRWKIDFDAPDSAGAQAMRVRRVGRGSRGGAVVAVGTTGADVPVDGGGTVRAGVYDDPFFFDLDAFLGSYDFCNAPGGTPGDSGVDFFAGLNVSAIVLEIPRAQLPAGTVGIWARTDLDGQVDRMGRPAINTVFVPTDSKNAFNAGKPRHDTRDFASFLGPLAGLLLPDMLTVDPASAAGFLNGRRLADDVIDIELSVITGNATAGDCVDANDLPFAASFPYLAPAH